VSQQHRSARLLRALLVLLSVLGLGATSFAAAHGGGARDRTGAVLAAARQHHGSPYVWGAVGPQTFDCSGLTTRLWTVNGHVRRMPRTAAQQQAWAVPIPEEQARPGDLAFFGDPVTHVGLVTGREATGRLRMIDASSSQKGVVERLVWSSGVVRFGRVPRPGMPAVRPWTPPPLPAKPAPVPAGPLVSPRDPALHGKAPMLGLPRTPTRGTVAMRRFAALARAQVGAWPWTDTALVTALWRQVGGTALPATREALARRTHRVLVGRAQVGDLVLYPAPAEHVGIYVGGGRMVDASRALGKVVLRPVWASPGAQIVRWDR
jgi:cell wall-associated NlpC family hydrolase